MTTFTIRLDPAEEARLRAAAAAANLPLEAWMEKTLIAAAADDRDALADVLDVISMARYQVILSDALQQAREWVGYEFSAAEVGDWLACGCTAPTTAAALRTRGLTPAQLGVVWRESYERAGTALTLGGGIALGHLSVEEVAALFDESEGSKRA